MKKTTVILALVLVAVMVTTIAVAQQRPAGAPQAQRERPPENPLNKPDAPRPIDALDSVWIEELTWMEVRDAMKAGKTTIIIPTGGIEPNGPYLALGKHNYVLRETCEAIARKLGNALVAPIIPLVPEGGMDPKTGHMTSPGTITMRDATYEAMLTDVGESMKQHGFKHVVYLGDSGGNQTGMKNVATRLNQKFGSQAMFHFIPEYYNYAAVGKMLDSMGIKEKPEGLHDDFGITAIMAVNNPATIRAKQREKAGKATINGVSILPIAKTVEIGKKIIALRADQTIEAIHKSIAAGGTRTNQ